MPSEENKPKRTRKRLPKSAPSVAREEISAEEKKPKSPFSELKDLIENANKMAGLIAAKIAAITFASGNRVLSYAFILIACFSLDWFLWRAIRQRVAAIAMLGVITAASLGWVGVNAWDDFQKAEGILFPPAKSGELLVILAEFEARGTEPYEVRARIQKQLDLAIKEAGITNVRIEKSRAVKDDDDARRLGQIHRAVFVIWGWYDKYGFNPNFTITRESQRTLVKTDLREVAAEQREFNLYIREALPAQMAYFATFTLGQLYYWDKKYDDALRAFDVALINLDQSRRIEQIPPPTGLSSLYSYRGYIFLAIKGNEDRAIVDYSKAIELDPKYADAYYNRGIAYKRKGNLDQAIADYSKAIELDPKLATAYNNRGIAYRAKGNLDQAIADYTKAIELDPKNATAYNNRGIVYAEQKKYDQAIADFSKAIELDPKYAFAYNNRGNAYSDQKKYDQAIADYSKAIELDPKYANAYWGRGLAFREKGLKAQAIADFEMYLRLVPNASDRTQVEQFIRELKGQ